ncbi:hypothetical protein ILUMI_01206 [Ignelater luminosus]|uniref:PPAF-2-like Clip domain-containing protein n=1 Tax=Ignelater luminosus TaxID=2038154 RepID=A0A8K0GPF7_IGNLU|nr:hypothetical protein ILUMI_01206 [Ignelater luminosus]
MNQFLVLLIASAIVTVFASEEKTEKCGEGKDKGIHKCVPYYQCDPASLTIIGSGAEDYDIRIPDNCDDYLQMCCEVDKITETTTTIRTSTEEENTAKCGEGEDEGIHKCVPYYTCDKGSSTSSYTCENYLDFCCKVNKVRDVNTKTTK